MPEKYKKKGQLVRLSLRILPSVLMHHSYPFLLMELVKHGKQECGNEYPNHDGNVKRKAERIVY
jgi:hypothetical protein